MENSTLMSLFFSQTSARIRNWRTNRLRAGGKSMPPALKADFLAADAINSKISKRGPPKEVPFLFWTGYAPDAPTDHDLESQEEDDS